MAVNKNFIVKHGLEVDTNLIFANGDTNRVGIGTTVPQYTLHVFEGTGIGATNIFVTGITTVINELRVGTGGTIFSVIAGPTGFGQSVGVGTSTPAFLLDVHSPVSTGQTAIRVRGDGRITGNLVIESGVTLSTLNVTGISTFVGFTTFQDYVFIQDGLNVTGTGATLSSLNVTGVSTFAGITTVTGTTLFSKQLNVSGVSTFAGITTVTGTTLFSKQLNVSGVSTFAGITTVTGPTLFSKQLNVSGVSTFVGFSTFNDYVFIQDGLNVTGTGATSTTLNVTGVSTFVGFSTFNDYVFIQDGLNVTGTGATLTTLNVTGVSTFAGITTVTGPTLFSKQLNVSGVSTFVGFSTFNDYVFIQDGLNVTGAGATIGTVKISSGIITATSGVVTYFGDGSQLTGNARNLTATIGIGTSAGVVGYGVSFLDLRGPGLSTIFYNSTVGIATIFFQGGGGSASIGIGTTPGEAFTGIITAGNLWYNSGLGRLFIYYQDIDSVQWVDASPSSVGIITSLTNVSFSAGSATAPSMHFIGDSQTGFFSPGAGQITFVSVGSSILNINPSGINVTGVVTATDFNSLSDANYKENVATVDSALSKVDQLRGVKFDWKESGLPSYGVIAQELQEVLPELVHGNDPKTVNYNGIVGVLIEAIKELKAEVEELKKDK